MSKNHRFRRLDFDNPPTKKQHLDYEKITYIQFARVMRMLIHDNAAYARATRKVESFMPDGFREYCFSIRPYGREARVTVLRKLDEEGKQLNITAKLQMEFVPHTDPVEFSGKVLQEVRGGLQEVVIDDYLE
jgi:hypothetical protein